MIGPCRPPRIPVAALVLAAAALSLEPAELTGQTPEQRYADWVPRLDFRPQEYAFRRSYMIRLLRESGGGVLLVPSSDGRTHGETFRQLDDFLYYTGLEVPSSMLVLDADTERATLYLPDSDVRFENPGRPNDFPGRPLLSDYRLRSIAGVEEYRSIDDLESLIRARAGGSHDSDQRRRPRARPDAGPSPLRCARPHPDDDPAAAHRLSRRTARERLRADGPDAHGQDRR